jgi:hypothetical protein
MRGDRYDNLSERRRKVINMFGKRSQELLGVAVFQCLLFAHSPEKALGDGIPRATPIPGTILVIEPIDPDSPLNKTFRAAREGQNFSLGYYKNDPIKLPRVEGRSRRETCESFLSVLVDKHANPIGFTFVEGEKNGLIRFRIGVAPLIEVYLWIHVEERIVKTERWDDVDLPVGFLIAK